MLGAVEPSQQAGVPFDDTLEELLRGGLVELADGAGGMDPQPHQPSSLAKDELLGWLDEAEAELAQQLGRL
jgi:hypothetical protein